MPNNFQSTTTLHNGVKMPWLGLGVFKMEDGSEVTESVVAAIKHGYRSIDTAAVYKNEAGVGQAIKQAGIPREDLFITSKVWNGSQGYETTLQAFEESLERLGLDYLDLYLIHWPVPALGKYKETWRAMEKLYKDGKIRAIGVSNFKESHLEDLIKDSEIVPMVNQVEFHPHLTQESLRAYCNEHKIQLEAWSPLKQGKLLDDPTLSAIADKYGKSTAQVILRWDLQSGVVTIPKSVKEHRIVANSDVFDFELTTEEMNTIDGLNKDERVGPDPDEFNRA
ncbi:diketogulonate reductase-like aldo/keto reductase [Natronobacillus azotifigens]|uniref:Aldo/keto reductase n=1 Tax=Natronobacillus azotifigens TaxID=472978 RepID=A0A9J6RAY3_9BACI|nr:aldo/keto reductase [Natronobacillus azotifigens]MCZ0702476.1 aldo/keto reductase [Natronobacillus azotifigens]